MSFYFKDKSSDEMSVILEDEVFDTIPEINYEDIDIEGRDGDIYQELNYKDVQITKNAYLTDLRKADAVKAWLTGSGVFVIGDRWKTARVYAATEFTRYGSFKYSFSIAFILSPFWKMYEGFETIGTGSSDLAVFNRGTVASKPILRITQTTAAEIEMAIGGVRFKLPGLGQGKTIEIDCENKSEDKPANISIGYNYPVLNPGVNTITVYAGVPKVEARYKDWWI